MRMLYVILSFLLSLSLAATRNNATFKSWSKNCKEFDNFSIRRSELRANEYIQALPQELLLVDPDLATLFIQSPDPIIISRNDIRGFPPMIKRFFEVIFGTEYSSGERDFKTAQNIYQLLRIICNFEDTLTSPIQSTQTQERITRLLWEESVLQISHVYSEQAKTQVDDIIRRLFPGDAPVKPAYIEWLLRLKLSANRAVRTALDGTGDKILLYADGTTDNYLGFPLNAATNTFQGRNILGKAWMYVRDNPVSLFVNDWFEDIKGAACEINDSMIPSGLMNSTKFDRNLKCLEMAAGDLPITVGISGNTIIPTDIRNQLSRIDSGFNIRFSSAETLYQFVRLLRHRRTTSALDTANVRSLAGSPSNSATASVNSQIGENAEKLQCVDDLEWILRLKAQQHESVRVALQRCVGRYLFTECSDVNRNETWGMRARTNTVYEGQNILGKTWMKILSSQAQTASEQPRAAQNPTASASTRATPQPRASQVSTAAQPAAPNTPVARQPAASRVVQDTVDPAAATTTAAQRATATTTVRTPAQRAVVTPTPQAVQARATQAGTTNPAPATTTSAARPSVQPRVTNTPVAATTTIPPAVATATTREAQPAAATRNPPPAQTTVNQPSAAVATRRTAQPAQPAAAQASTTAQAAASTTPATRQPRATNTPAAANNTTTPAAANTTTRAQPTPNNTATRTPPAASTAASRTPPTAATAAAQAQPAASTAAAQNQPAAARLTPTARSTAAQPQATGTAPVRSTAATPTIGNTPAARPQTTAAPSANASRAATIQAQIRANNLEIRRLQDENDRLQAELTDLIA